MLHDQILALETAIKVMATCPLVCASRQADAPLIGNRPCGYGR
jgi:hypothetical protein